MAEAHRDELRKSFKDVKYFSATSDIWTRSNNSFIAVSVHYLEDDSTEVKSKFIACEYFPGHHNNTRVARALAGIFDRFEILDRVRYITTDNAGEYCAAFKNFGANNRVVEICPRVESKNAPSHSNYSNPNENATNELDETDDEYDSDPDDAGRFERNLSDDAPSANPLPESFYINTVDALEGDLAHMNRVQCSAHKLDKVGKVDAERARGDEYDDLHERVFTKLEAIWKVKDSRTKAEDFFRITGKKLVGPHRIRWLQTCEAVC